MTASDADAGVCRDASDLRRSVALNLIGYAINVATPVLVWAVIWAYGARDYGVFVAGQATMMIGLRLGVLGLDKSLLWWIPRRRAEEPFAGLGAALGWVGSASAIATVVVMSSAEAWGIRWMALALVPMALTEVLVGAAAAHRELGSQVLVRDGLVPVVTAALALLLWAMGLGGSGLPLAYVGARVIGLFATLAVVRRQTALRPIDLLPARLDPELVRYSVPLWLGELASSFLQRMDVLALAATSTPEVVGVYGAVLQVGNTLKAIRGSFDSIVTAIFAEIGASGSRRRLRAGFSHATSIVLATQIPVWVAIVLFADPLMRLLGPGYEAGTTAVLVVVGFALGNTVIGLHGHVVRAFGRASWMLAGMLATIAVLAPLLRWLIPLHGITGAALAVGLAYLFQNMLWLGQSTAITRQWLYDRAVVQVVALGLASTAVTLATRATCVAIVGDLPARIVASAVFLAIYGLGVRHLSREAAPHTDSSARASQAW